MEMNIELYEKLSRMQWLLHKQHLKTHAAGGPMADTSRGQGRIIAALKMKDGISTKDLSYLLGIRVSSLNELLAKLEKTGYINREASETDKRIMLIHLTDKGREEEEKGQDISGVFACLSAEEQASFGDYLDRIIAALEAELGTDDERDGLFDWMAAARARMGEEQFDELVSMHGGMHNMRGGFGDGRFRGGFPGFGQGRHDATHPHAWGGKGGNDKNPHSPFHKGPHGESDK
ncbi:MAG: putative transcriptional regulator [Anaerocolumna sp.]|nr:putative transcriptional regulator [Anaerocolumna sp.]